MLRNRSFIVYGRIFLRIMKVLDLKEPRLFWCNFFTLSFVDANSTVHISPYLST
jgi:hypothetical protein